MLNDLLELKKMKEGDVKAFEKIFRHYYAPLCLFGASITGDKEIAEEIVQDLFYIFWKERQNLHLFHSVKSYLYGAVRNRCLQYHEHMDVRERFREKVLSGELSGRNSNPQDILEYKELEELINRTLDKLPERRVLIFRMHRMEGKKYTEIAETLSLSIKTVEAEMTKALQALRKEVEIYIQTT